LGDIQYYPYDMPFACDFILEAFDGPVLKRNLDEATGLPLWEIEKNLTKGT